MPVIGWEPSNWRPSDEGSEAGKRAKGRAGLRNARYANRRHQLAECPAQGKAPASKTRIEESIWVGRDMLSPA
jgi:hypothetical protein